MAAPRTVDDLRRRPHARTYTAEVGIRIPRTLSQSRIGLGVITVTIAVLGYPLLAAPLALILVAIRGVSASHDGLREGFLLTSVRPIPYTAIERLDTTAFGRARVTLVGGERFSFTWGLRDLERQAALSWIRAQMRASAFD